MRLLVWEYACGGACREPAAWLREGAAMLEALVDDCRHVPGIDVCAFWSASLAAPSDWENVRWVRPVSPSDEARQFERELEVCDAAWIIAPETDQLLESRLAWVARAHRMVIGPHCGAAHLCGDKLALASHLMNHGVPTLPTRLVDWSDAGPPPGDYPLVLKPRDGAGSQLIYFLGGVDDWSRRRTELRSAFGDRAAVVQPFIAGSAASVALWIEPGRDGPASRGPPAGEGHVDAHAAPAPSADQPAGPVVRTFPVCEQHLSSDGRFRYLGGRTPARFSAAACERMATLATQACRTVAGLAGYVGVDLIVSDGSSAAPLVVEINLRLTTSYLGYRRVWSENPWPQLLAPWLGCLARDGAFVDPGLALQRGSEAAEGRHAGLFDPGPRWAEWAIVDGTFAVRSGS